MAKAETANPETKKTDEIKTEWSGRNDDCIMLLFV